SAPLQPRAGTTPTLSRYGDRPQTDHRRFGTAQPTEDRMTRLGSLYPYDIVNVSGETLPAFGIAMLHSSGNTTVNKRLFTGVTKPDGGPGVYLINGPTSVEDDGFGKAGFASMPVWVKYSGTAPGQGDTVGPVDDNWTVTTDGTGFVV